MIREVIVASARIFMYFQEEVGTLLNLNVFLGDHIADNGCPGIQLVRNPGISNAGLRDNCNSCLRLAVGVALTLWVVRNGPPLGMVGRPLGKYVPDISCSEWRKLTHADSRLAPNGTTVGKTRTLKNNNHEQEVIGSARGDLKLTGRDFDTLSL
jgi:hypothetical protein